MILFLYRKLASANLALCDAYDAAIFKLFVIDRDDLLQIAVDVG